MLQLRYPRFFEAVVQANTGKPLLSRQRGINWLLRTIEVIYNALAADCLLLKIGSEKADTESASLEVWAKPKNSSQSLTTTPAWLAMPSSLEGSSTTRWDCLN
ncbi:hypothetical protein Pcac1_g29141 [Phytophthora cactorum]|nr:hypothetical protein Pcac1_g29141 [Phytophthora cactorum]